MSDENKIIIGGVDIPFSEKVKLAFQWFLACIVGVGIPVALLLLFLKDLIQ